MMTLIDPISPGTPAGRGHGHGRAHFRAPVPRRAAGVSRGVPPRIRPPGQRPAGSPVRYRGTGVLMSQTSHRPRPITPANTVVLALVAAAITLWLGLMANLGATVARTGAVVPEKLGVVQVHVGESLQHLAARVAPDAPNGQVVARIRDLNQLDSAALDAGETLIAPIG